MSPLPRRTGLRRRARLARGDKPLRRTTGLSPTTPLRPHAFTRPAGATGRSTPAPRTLRTPQRPAFRNDAEREMASRWQIDVLAAGQCAACGATNVPMQGHHVLPQRLLRPLECRRGLPPGTLLWDARLGLCLCSEPAPNRCHQRHELAVKRVPRHKLRVETIAFADELDQGWFIDRHYPAQAQSA